MGNSMTIGMFLCLALLTRVNAETAPNSRDIENKKIANCVASGTDTECRLLGLEIIAENPNRSALRLDVLQLLDDESKPFLRKLVQESPDTEFQFAATAALAHMGDLGIVVHLKERRNKYVQDGNRRMVGALDSFLWKIEVQETPETLLAFIATYSKYQVEKRLWAIQRAYDRNIPKADIRKAILEHAAKVKTNEHGFRPGLSSIKRTGILLGILTDADLPGVKYVLDMNDIVSE